MTLRLQDFRTVLKANIRSCCPYSLSDKNTGIIALSLKTKQFAEYFLSIIKMGIPRVMKIYPEIKNLQIWAEQNDTTINICHSPEKPEVTRTWLQFLIESLSLKTLEEQQRFLFGYVASDLPFLFKDQRNWI